MCERDDDGAWRDDVEGLRRGRDCGSMSRHARLDGISTAVSYKVTGGRRLALTQFREKHTCLMADNERQSKALSDVIWPSDVQKDVGACICARVWVCVLVAREGGGKAIVRGREAFVHRERTYGRQSVTHVVWFQIDKAVYFLTHGGTNTAVVPSGTNTK